MSLVPRTHISTFNHESELIEVYNRARHDNEEHVETHGVAKDISDISPSVTSHVRGHKDGKSNNHIID